MRSEWHGHVVGAAVLHLCSPPAATTAGAEVGGGQEDPREHIQVSDGVCCTWQEGVQFTDFKLPLNKYLPGAEAIFKSLHCDSGTMNMAHILQIRMK